MKTSDSDFSVEAVDQELENRLGEEKKAVELISIIGQLLYGRSIELVIFRNSLLNIGVPEILDLHEYSKNFVKKPVNIYTTASLAAEIADLDLAPSILDIGKLANEWNLEKENFSDQKAFLEEKLKGYIGLGENEHVRPRDVVLYGFGRIGRLVARELITQAGKGRQLRLKAIVARKNSGTFLSKRAALFRSDSVHGPFTGTVVENHENNSLTINGQIIKMIEAQNPDEIDYSQYGIEDALVIDNTGAFRDKASLSRHLASAGTKKVLLTAPGKGIANTVYGVNHKELDLEGDDIFSAASCTTNAIVPVLKVINDNLGIEKGHIESIHAYTNDQNLLDNMHKKHRRGRSAAINMVITETGAAKAVVKVIPDLDGKLTANAVRVPTPNGSLAIMNLTVSRETTVDEVNSIMRKAALKGDLVTQIQYSSEEELVSNDIIGTTCPAIFDSPATLVSSDGKSIVLYTWYDNEFGYVMQVMRLAKHVMKVKRLVYY